MKHKYVKMQIRVGLGGNIRMQGGLECVLTQKCALEMSAATLYKSFSMQQKRTLSLDLANGIVNNYFCLLVMRTKTK